jgi:hypothetical protein
LHRSFEVGEGERFLEEEEAEAFQFKTRLLSSILSESRKGDRMDFIQT